MIMHEGDPSYDFSNPGWHVVYRDPPSSFNAIRDGAIDLCKNDITHELFGLNYIDLMDMDYSTFSRIKKVIYELAKQKSEQVKAMQEGLAANNQPKG